MKQRKRIAVLAGQPEEAYQEQFLSGFLSKAFEYDYDVCVFAMYQRYQDSEVRERGESSIFSLINYDQFDGVVLMLDSIQTPGVAEQLCEKISKIYDGKVLTIDVETKYFPHLDMDHYTPTQELISHLIELHGLTDIAYLTGRKEHKHSKIRLQAYKDCMAEHGLSILPGRIFYGDYWYGSGEQTAETLLRQSGKMPQAIACANDYMAIGVAKVLSREGYRIPEDIAIIGYDSVAAGQDSPKPITSISVPVKKYGAYAAEYIDALINDIEMPPFKTEGDFFIGNSCGCNNESVVPKIHLREHWHTEMSERDYFSLNNHMSEDLLCQTNFYDLMNTLNYYVYQIRDFETFHICLNEDWDDTEKRVVKGKERENYTERILHVLTCKKDDPSQDVVSFDTYFDRQLLLPEIYKEHAEPSVYYFTPLYFEDNNFGYAVLQYVNQPQSYSSTYRMWLRSVMQSFECYRRIESIERSKQLLEDNMVRDTLTGLFNYKGFARQKDKLMRKILLSYYNVGVIAIDIKELAKINDVSGRAEGDRVVIMLANTLKDVFPGAVNICLGNGEMVSIVLSKEDANVVLQDGYKKILSQVKDHNRISTEDYELELYCGMESGNPQNVEELERLVNVAISKKNGNKIKERKLTQGEKFTEEEYKEATLVQKLLDDNRFKYHFQPIVYAKNGNIYGYEALMRADIEPYIAPPIVLKYAEYSGRLYDVEKATFFNVLDIVKKNKRIFNGNTKIFINSIPGYLLHDKDAVKLEEVVKNLQDTVVVELTEQLELTDEELFKMKEYYEKLGLQTAIDDYGTGYSNVTNLLRYMPNVVKIDRMLLTNIQESPQKQHFVKDIITFAHDNNILALAEGVETAEELQMVIHLGVDLIQGYYVARPGAEILEGIHKDIRNEILEYNRVEKHNRGRKVYEAGKEARISLGRLVAEKYSIIEILAQETHSQDITIHGVPDLETDMYLRIKNGYTGKITLDSVTLMGEKHGACIDIGNDCDVKLILVGDNRCINGGIRVPSGSRLTVSGSGHMQISVDAANYFGIGNSSDAKHGELIFNQDGIIEIKGSGMRGVGIGSGLGGVLHIEKGKYIINLVGQEGVGIGALTGDVVPIIKNCDMRIETGTERAVALGSLFGNVYVKQDHISFVCELNGDDIVAIGSLRGKNVHVEMSHVNVKINIRAYRIHAIGTQEGELYVNVRDGSILITGDGTESYGIGNAAQTGNMTVYSAKVENIIRTKHNTNQGIKKENIQLLKGECIFLEESERMVLSAD